MDILTYLSTISYQLYITSLKILDEALCLGQVQIKAIESVLEKLSSSINQELSHLKPSHVIIVTLLLALVVRFAIDQIHGIFHFLRNFKLLKTIRRLPIIRSYVDKKLSKINAELKGELDGVYNKEGITRRLPLKSSSFELVVKKAAHYKSFDTSNWQQGRISGAIYTNNDKQYNDVMANIYGHFMWSNPLHSDVFAGVRKMEAEIIRMVIDMYRGDPEQMIGSVTSGGTESIIMACKAYRDYGIHVRGIKGKPEIVAPRTAHAAFEKAARILGCRIVHVPVDPVTLKVDLRALQRSISPKTCMLVGSAPQFPHGIIDPIAKIAKLGLKHKIPVHVDACLGGFLIPFMRKTKHELDEEFDFTVPGVTSISVDTHKYGYAPKGTSVIMYREKKYIHHQYSVQTDWPGGIYASPTIPGSRPGGLIATCWAAMIQHGEEGYVAATDSIVATTKLIKEELRQVDGINVMGDPMVSVVAIESDKFDIYELNGRLKSRGWNLNALQFPSAIHLCITKMHTSSQVAESFVRDVKLFSKELLAEPRPKKATGTAAIYGMAQTVADRSIVTQICTMYLDACLGY